MGNIIKIVRKNAEIKEKYIDISKLISVEFIDDKLIRGGDFVTDCILDLTFIDNSKEKFIFQEPEKRQELFNFILKTWNNNEKPLEIEL